nr:immunoglobulin light chain junction region [Macaca mulatta]
DYYWAIWHSSAWIF